MLSVIKAFTNKIYLVLLGIVSVVAGVLVFRAKSLKTEAENQAKKAEKDLLGYESAHTKEYLKAEAAKISTEKEIGKKVAKDTKKTEDEIVVEYAELQSKLENPEVDEFKVKL